eukprot:403330816
MKNNITQGLSGQHQFAQKLRNSSFFNEESQDFTKSSINQLNSFELMPQNNGFYQVEHICDIFTDKSRKMSSLHTKSNLNQFNDREDLYDRVQNTRRTQYDQLATMRQQQIQEDRLEILIEKQKTALNLVSQGAKGHINIKTASLKMHKETISYLIGLSILIK